MQCLLVIQLSHSAPRHFVQAQVCVCLDSVFCKNFWSFSFVSAHQAVVRHSVLACVFTFHFQALSLSRRLIFGFFRVWAQWKWQGLIWLSLKFYFFFFFIFPIWQPKKNCLVSLSIFLFSDSQSQRNEREDEKEEERITSAPVWGVPQSIDGFFANFASFFLRPLRNES